MMFVSMPLLFFVALMSLSVSASGAGAVSASGAGAASGAQEAGQPDHAGQTGQAGQVGQGATVTSSRDGDTLDLSNPLSILEAASQAHPLTGQAAGQGAGGDSQSGTADTSGDKAAGGIDTTLSIVLLLTVLTIAPSFLVMTTSFTRIVIVLGLLRQALGTQWLPPTQVIVGLSLFMTLLVMAPTFDRINEQAIKPLSAKEIDSDQAWKVASGHLKDFMFEQIDYADNWDDLYMILEYRGVDTSDPKSLTRGDVDLLALTPAFILSELKVAFLMGFRLYLPFLIIDLVVSSMLVSMGMFMLPPALISLPFKILLFVMSDGWHLVVGNLLASFAIPGVT